MLVTFKVKIYQPTNTKGLRFRIIGLSNKFIAFDYFYNSVLEQTLDILGDNGYSKEQIISVNWVDKDSTYYVAVERW